MVGMGGIEIALLLLASSTAGISETLKDTFIHQKLHMHLPSAVKILQFQGDGQYSTDSFVYSPPLGRDLTNFTLCTWFRADYWRSLPHLFQLATHNDTNILSNLRYVRIYR